MVIPLKLYSVSSDSWGEDTVTWSNEPGPDALLATINVSDVGPITFDITAHVEAELAGDKQVSLVLLDDSGTNQMLRFKSRTVENDPPSLALVPSLAECTPSLSAPILDLALDATDLSWTSAGAGVGYDVVRGHVGALLASNGDFTLATEACMADDLAITNLFHGADPAVGEAFWYLVRVGLELPGGSYDSGGAAQVAPRDPGILGSGSDCP